MPALVAAQLFIIHPPVDLLTRYPQLRRNSLALARRYAFHELVTEEMLQRMGNGLWSVLEMDDAFEVARQQSNPAILPIVIESDLPELQSLPWETLYHPQYGFLGKSPLFTLSRRSSIYKRATLPPEKGPLRVLLFTSLPDDLNPETSRLNVEEEQAQVQEALARWEADGTVQLEIPNDGSFSTFKHLLKAFQPQLVFLSGHGQFYQEPHSNEPPYGEFIFENEICTADPVRDRDLAQAFIGTKAQLVVLSACESGMAASTNLNNGLAAQLSALGIPHVVGMRESVLDMAGIRFAHSLCDRLAQQERIDIALQTARAAIAKPLEGLFRQETQLAGVTKMSLGQWCLPALWSKSLEQPLIDWDFQRLERSFVQTNQSLSTISLPPRFIGRRFELRQLSVQVQRGKQLLITGPGGQGKTTLAGKLAQDLQKKGYEILAWAARPENPWDAFVFELELMLDDSHAKQYDRMRPRLADEAARAELLLRFLMAQTQNRLILFFDNLKSIQDPNTHQLEHPAVTAWIKAAQSQTVYGLIILLTSRWSIPGWPEEDHQLLGRVSYGDFLTLAQLTRLPDHFFHQYDRLRQVYNTLHGNGRGLEFFAAAVAEMDVETESAFLDKLAQARVETQANMALDAIIGRLNPTQRAMLDCLPVYLYPVPLEGLLKITLDLPGPEKLLEALLAVSLVERHYNQPWQVDEYQLSALVIDWLEQKRKIPLAIEKRILAADFLTYLYEQERTTLFQAQVVHQSMVQAGLQDQANRFALDHIIGPLSRAGFYHILLKDWLPAISGSDDPHIRSQALGQSGIQLLHIGDYDTALDYLKQSLAIQRQIGDKAGEGTTLNNISQIYDARGDYDTALDYLKQSLAIQRQIGDKAGEGATLNNISQIYDARGDYDTALDYLKQSLAIQRQIGDKAGEGATLNNMATAAYARGDYDTALDYLKQSLAIRQQIGDKAGEGTTLNNMATAAYARGDYDTALDYLKQSLAIRQQIGDKAGEGTTLNNMATAAYARGDYDTALDYLKQSLAIQRQIGDKAGEGTTLNNMATAAYARGDYDTALDYLKQSLAIQRQIGDKAGEGTTLNNISQIYDARGDYDTALDYLKQSLAIQRQIGDKAGEGATLNNMATAAYARGDYDTALDYLKQSLAIRQQIGDKAGEGTTLNNISQIFKARGDYDTALDYLKQSLAIQRQIGDKAGEGTTLNNISQIYDARGDYDTALDYLKQSLAIRQQIGDKAGEGTTLNNMATAAYARGDYDTALDYLKQSLAIQRQIGDKAGEGATLNNMATAAYARGDYDTALDYLKQSLAIQRQIGDKAGEGATLNNISQIYDARGDYDTALDYLKQSLAIRQQIGDKAGEGTTLNNISQIYDARGDYDTALDYLKQSLAIRQQIGDKAGEGTTLNNISQIYDARGDYDTALDYLKQSLAIQRQIGDLSGLCATLFNIGHIHAQKEEMQEAFSAWLAVYDIAKKIGNAQALQALSDLAPQLGLPPGLDGWETLRQRLMD